MRTTDEILSRVEEVRETDFFGFETADLLSWLPYDKAKPYLKDSARSEDWTYNVPTHDAVLKCIVGYMPFAWKKANECRGLSAMRSLQHMKAWLWLLGDSLADELDDYTHYGKPQLRAICDKLGINWSSMDDNCWRNDESGPCESPDSVAKI